MVIIPLFPLPTVLLPGGKTVLQIFEPRYLSMIKSCMKESQGFGIVLSDANAPLSVADEKDAYHIASVGTLCSIVDFDIQSNGYLQITVQGNTKFHIESLSITENQIVMGQVIMIESEACKPVPEDQQHLVELMKTLAQHASVALLDLNVDLTSADQLSGRLTELLPFKNDFKQKMLELGEPLQRLKEIEAQLLSLQQSS